MSTARSCKTKYLAKSAAIYTVVSVGLLLTAKMLFAQQLAIRTITIVPPTIEHTVDKGFTTEGKLKLVNSSQYPLTFKAKVKDFIVDNTLGTPHILPDTAVSPKYSASAWIGVSPDVFTVEPGKTAEMTYYLQVPKDAKAGGHYAAVMYETQEVIGVKGTGTGVQTQLGTLFYIRVNGPIVENASVKRFEANPFQEYGPVKINTQIANYSDTHIRPRGSIVVKNLIGQVVDTQPLEEHNIFPEAARDLANMVGKKLMFGRYTAELKATYGTQNNLTLYAITSFIVFPWKIAGIVALVVIVAVLFFIFMRRNRKKRHGIPQTPAENVAAATPPPTQPQV